MGEKATWFPDPDIGIYMQHAKVYGLRVSVMRSVIGGKWFWGTFGCMGQNKPARSEKAAKSAAVNLAKEIHDAFSCTKFAGLIEEVDSASNDWKCEVNDEN